MINLICLKEQIICNLFKIDLYIGKCNSDAAGWLYVSGNYGDKKT